MQNATMHRSKGSPALKHGILFGIALGAVQLLLSLLTNYVHQGEVTLVVSIIGLGIALVMYLLAGKRAAQDTGRVGTGAFAGVWTGVISVLIGLVGTLLLAYENLGVMRQQAGAATQEAVNRLHLPIPITTDQLLLSTAALTSLTGLGIVVILGLIAGAIGGVIGRGHVAYVPQVAQESRMPKGPRD